jgi:hypothetical protein
MTTRVVVIPATSAPALGATAAAAESGALDFPHWRRPGLLLVVLGATAHLLRGAADGDSWGLPGAFGIASGLILLPAIVRALRAGTRQVLADHLLVLSGSFMLYFVFGALLIPFGPAAEARQAQSFYAVNPEVAMRVLAVNCIGFGLALVAGSLVRRRWAAGVSRSVVRVGATIPQLSIIAAFLVIGAYSSYYVWSFEIGLRSGVPSGLLFNLSRFMLVAIMLAVAHRGRGAAALSAAAVALTAAQGVVGLIMLNKSSVLLPLLALMAGLSWRLGVRRVLLPGFALIIPVFLLIAAPVNEGRDYYWAKSHVNMAVHSLERLAFLRDAFLHPGAGRSAGEYSDWGRLCYTAPQAAALDYYDAGQGGDDYRKLGWVFLPRFLFPNKPIMTSAGAEFSYKIIGDDSTYTGVGVFVDGYYNLGWFGVIAVGLSVGCILAWTSTFAAEVYAAGALIWLPAALLGSMMGFRIDGNFLADYWGPVVPMCYVIMGGMLLASRQKRSRGR